MRSILDRCRWYEYIEDPLFKVLIFEEPLTISTLVAMPIIPVNSATAIQILLFVNNCLKPNTLLTSFTIANNITTKYKIGCLLPIDNNCAAQFKNIDFVGKWLCQDACNGLWWGMTKTGFLCLPLKTWHFLAVSDLRQRIINGHRLSVLQWCSFYNWHTIGI